MTRPLWVPASRSRDAGQLRLQGLQLRAHTLGVLGAVIAALSVIRASLGQAGGPRFGLGHRLLSQLLLRFENTGSSWLSL